MRPSSPFVRQSSPSLSARSLPSPVKTSFSPDGRERKVEDDAGSAEKKQEKESVRRGVEERVGKKEEVGKVGKLAACFWCRGY